MADSHRGSFAERDIEQAITALKKGACLLKYGRRGKPKFCPFRLSNDETILIWYSDKQEKHLKLSHVSRIVPGQRTAIFQRYPRPEKEYQSFSLMYGERSLDVICKDKDEAEVWFVGLKALITRDHRRSKHERDSVDSSSTRTQRSSPSITPFDPGDTEENHSEHVSHARLGKAITDIATYTSAIKRFSIADSIPPASSSENSNSHGRNSATAEGLRTSLSSAVSFSSQGSLHDEVDALGDVFMWGEGVGGGLLGGGMHRAESPFDSTWDAVLPKVLESTVVLDVHGIACGGRHAVLVTRQGEIFSWGEEVGGRLGHGVEVDVSQPKLIESLAGSNVELISCGEYQTCAVTISGELFTWGGGSRCSGLLGHGNEVSHWIPRKVAGCLEGIHISYVSCGLWHTAAVTSAGQLFTFGDGSFGALGHGDRLSTSVPREVEELRGLRTTSVACGVWHSAAVVDGSSSGHLYTWGDGEKWQLGHSDNSPRLAPECVAAFAGEKICRVGCGHTLTVVLNDSGQVFTMGSTAFGQLGEPLADGKYPVLVRGKIEEAFVEEIACGAYHVAVLTSKTEVFTWGKGSHGQLGHGDNDNRDTPTLVDHLKDKQVKSVVCGSNFTAVICIHKWPSGADHSMCFGCHHAFGFRRKRHNCYNCGLVFCTSCSSKKSVKAALAPHLNKPYRVCDECFTKLKQVTETPTVPRNPMIVIENSHHRPGETAERESRNPKPQASLSRFSSFGSGNGYRAENCLYTENQAEGQNFSLVPSASGGILLNDINFLKASNPPIGGLKKGASVSVPVSRTISRATSPLSRKSSPQWSPEEQDLLHLNESLSLEIMALRTQVEDLTYKSQFLEAELEKTRKKWKEMTTIAAEEAEKSKSAREVIKSLTAQLKNLAERLPEGMALTTSGSLVPHKAKGLLQSGSGTSSHSATPDRESNHNSPSQSLSNGSKSPGVNEWVVHDEHGVYLTLSSLPDGGYELKRVRFSRKHFSEGQAEKWWAENSAKVCERHNVRMME